VEATALVADAVCEAARDGGRLADAIEAGRSVLTDRDVMPGVIRAVPEVPVWGATGDPNAAIDTAEPLVLGPQFGGCCATPAEISVMFVAQAAVDSGARLPGARRRVPVRRTRRLGSGSMIRHGRLGQVQVEPDTGRTTLDGDLLAAVAAESVPLSRLYFL
jgi:urease subunit alpha